MHRNEKAQSRAAKVFFTLDCMFTSHKRNKLRKARLVAEVEEAARAASRAAGLKANAEARWY